MVTTSKELMSAAGIDPRSPTDPVAWGGRLNIYVCDSCRSHIVTRDVDEGVTPFMIPSKEYCPNKCSNPKAPLGVNMTSSFYRVWNQSMREDYQWYRPSAEETIDPMLREHISKGGLILRERADG